MVEVFMIDSTATSNVGCAFIRMGDVKAAQKAIEDPATRNPTSGATACLKLLV